MTTVGSPGEASGNVASRHRLIYQKAPKIKAFLGLSDSILSHPDRERAGAHASVVDTIL